MQQGLNGRHAVHITGANKFITNHLNDGEGGTISLEKNLHLVRITFF